VIGPAPRLPGGVHVGAAEEVRLHVHLLDGQLAGQDAAAHPLVGGVEPAGMPDHADLAGFLLYPLDLLRVRPAVGDRDLDLHVLARAHRGDGLTGVQLRRRAQDNGVHVVTREHLIEIGRRDGNAIFARDSLGLLDAPADHGGDGHAVDVRQAVEVLDAERPCAGERDPHRGCLLSSVRHTGVSADCNTMCPTAVLDPGTW
jgi:hypothetical protein